MQQSPLMVSQESGAVFRNGLAFDALALRWQALPQGLPADLVPVDEVIAARHLFSRPGIRKLPVGVIGPREATAPEYEQALIIGRKLTEAGFQIICGGRGGAMEAVCRGAAEAGGTPIGILPDDDWTKANAFVALPLATGLGEARNALIASASFALVAVGGGYGTLSEIALGLRIGRLVVTMPPAHDVAGAVRTADPDEVIRLVARRYFALADR